jgi:hypothetical protein
MEPNSYGVGVGIVCYLRWMRLHCVTCGTVIFQGEFEVGIQVRGHGYLVGSNPPRVCCGQEQISALLFMNTASAVSAAKAAGDILQRDKGFENLRVIEVPQLGSATHH